MLRTNLSSRPFYNERLATFIIGVVGVVAVAVLVVSVQQVVSLSSTRTRLRAQTARDDAAASRADAQSIELQKQINNKSLRGLALSTQEANKLIDERTFSWTVFFGLIEKTLPNDVRVVSVAPVTDKTGFLVTMTVVSKRTEDLATFIGSLQGTGAFYDVLPRQEDATDDGNRRTSLEARYLPPKTEAPKLGADVASDAKPQESPAKAAPDAKQSANPAPAGKQPAKPAAPPIKKGGVL